MGADPLVVVRPEPCSPISVYGFCPAEKRNDGTILLGEAVRGRNRAVAGRLTSDGSIAVQQVRRCDIVPALRILTHRGSSIFIFSWGQKVAPNMGIGWNDAGLWPFFVRGPSGRADIP
jgi:hypothetical protein